MSLINFRTISLALSGLFFSVAAVGSVQAATFTVNGTTGNDTTCTAGGTPCKTIGGAIAKTAASGDVIVVAAGTYPENITSAALAGKNLTITGAGADTTIVDGSGNRVFDVDATSTLDLSKVTIQNGKAGGSSEGGGGIRNKGTMILRESVVKTCDTSDGMGGGVGNVGTMTIMNSTISGNQAQTNGAGIANGGRQITANESAGTLVMVNSTISGNTSRIGGGAGLSNISCDPLSPPCSTTTTASTSMLFNVTISNNTGNDSSPSTEIAEGGGGINVKSGTVTLKNTLLAGNKDISSQSAPDCFGSLSSGGFNLVGNNNACTFSSSTGDQVGTAASPINPLLAALGLSTVAPPGTTPTHALTSGSPAIDKGNSTACVDQNGATLNTDQRGSTRPLAGISGGPVICDIGAYEAAAGTTPSGGGGGGGGCSYLPFSAFHHLQFGSSLWILGGLGLLGWVRRKS